MAFSSWRTWVTGEVVTAAHMNQEVRDNGNAMFPDEVSAANWTPGLGGDIAGAAVTTTGRKYRIGALQFGWAKMTISSPGSGFYHVNLPVSAVNVSVSANEGAGQTVGTWTLRNNSVPDSRNGSVLLRTVDEIWFNVGSGMMTAATPFLIQSGDVLSFNIVYPVA